MFDILLSSSFSSPTSLNLTNPNLFPCLSTFAGMKTSPTLPNLANLGHRSTALTSSGMFEMANAHNWLNLWIETDSRLAVLAFNSNSLVPWAIRNRWQNCKLLTEKINFMITHIYREGNDIADCLAGPAQSKCKQPYSSGPQILEGLKFFFFLFKFMI
ncbi:hypothetical protein QL285_013197 [Trifolium repens]|nr:hypothetical protein QL285_013197 [Trifolium repens]